MTDFKKQVLDMLDEPVEEAKQRAEKIKTAADRWAKSVEGSVLARFAKALGRPSKPDTSDDALLELVSAVSEIPEARALLSDSQSDAPRGEIVPFPTRATEPDNDVDADDLEPMDYPRLHAAGTKKPLLLVTGSTLGNERTGWIERAAGRVEWGLLPKSGRVDSISTRIKNGHFSCVVLFHHIMTKIICDELVSACESARVPYARAGKPGTGGIRTAFAALEESLAKKAVG